MSRGFVRVFSGLFSGLWCAHVLTQRVTRFSPGFGLRHVCVCVFCTSFRVLLCVFIDFSNVQGFRGSCVARVGVCTRFTFLFPGVGVRVCL